MRKFLTALLLSITCIAGAQVDTISAPFQKFPNNIPLDLLLVDSNTVMTSEGLNEERPFMLILFSPECEHCKKATEDIINNIGLFKDIDIIMATPLPFDEMKKFYTDYQLSRFPNIVMGRDHRFMLPSYYQVRYLPFLAFYGKNRKLIGFSAQAMNASDMAAYFRK
ncbi:MAG: thioredoxin [Chitinophagaceae bacterium]